MAMNKTERKQLEDALMDRDMARALRWPEYGKPEMVHANDYGEIVTGFIINSRCATDGNVGRGVEPGWTTSGSHGYGALRPGRGIQNGRPLFTTRLDALKGLRLELTEMFARKLAEVDRLIAAEQDVKTEK